MKLKLSEVETLGFSQSKPCNKDFALLICSYVYVFYLGLNSTAQIVCLPVCFFLSFSISVIKVAKSKKNH
jgi:hypothetical protein